MTKRRKCLSEDRECDEIAILTLPGSEHDKCTKRAQNIWRKFYGTTRNFVRSRIDKGVKRKAARWQHFQRRDV